jgi:hypothetical protein
MGEDSGNNRIRVQSLCFGFVGKHDTMSQNRMGGGLYVLRFNKTPPVK